MFPYLLLWFNPQSLSLLLNRSLATSLFSTISVSFTTPLSLIESCNIDTHLLLMLWHIHSVMRGLLIQLLFGWRGRGTAYTHTETHIDKYTHIHNTGDSNACLKIHDMTSWSQSCQVISHRHSEEKEHGTSPLSYGCSSWGLAPHILTKCGLYSE